MPRTHLEVIRRPLLIAVLAPLALLASVDSRAQRPRWGEFRSEAEARGHVPADLPLRPTPRRQHEQTGAQTVPIVRRVLPGRLGPVPMQGGLSGKSVYLSPGHGWTHGSGGWVTQRGNLLGVVEDLSNVDGVSQFLLPYLLNAGALVVPVREIDPTSHMVILDESDGSKDPSRGRYQESGDSSVFTDSVLPGWGHPGLPLAGTTNPFSLGKNRAMAVSATETARAVFVPNLPAAGYYNLYISYSMHSSRASDAQVTVAHPGGQTIYLVDQRRHGGSWVLLGRFYFEAGMNESKGAVIVSNQSKDAGAAVSIDAIRLGGGMGLLDRGGGTSKQPRADENSRYHAQFCGAPATVYDSSTSGDATDDISTRSRFADWLHAPGEPAVYVSHHSNAFKGTSRGTESYIYGPNPPDGTYQPTATTLALGSDKLGKAVHGQIIADLRAAWDPAWNDRKLMSAYFGELNTAYQDEMPAVLIEAAFHDQPDDIGALKEAAFRRILARAVYRGIVKFFAAQDGTTPVLLPEPPQQVIARNGGSGSVILSWSAPPSGGVNGDAPTSYRVYRSSHGYAFDEGTDTAGKTSLTVNGLRVGEVVYFRVAATNAGGLSLPSPTLAVGVGQEKAALLLVTGFTRLDARMNLQVETSGLGKVDRLLLERMNDGSYLVPHGRALSSTRIPFDACTHDAVERGSLSLAGYRLLLWQAGKGLNAARALGDGSRAALEAAAASGASLILSGSSLASQLGGSGALPEDQSFLRDRLRAGLAGLLESPGEIAPTSGGPLQGLESWTLSGPSSGVYHVQSVDTLSAVGEAEVAAGYQPAGGAAVISRPGGACSALLGFPLETVLPAARQAELLQRLLAHCGLEPPPPPDGSVLDGGGPAGDGMIRPGSEGSAPPPEGCSCSLPSSRSAAAVPTWSVLLLLGLLARLRTRPGRGQRPGR